MTLLPGCVSSRPAVIHDLPHQQPGRVRLALQDGSEVITAQTMFTRDSIFGRRVGREAHSPQVRLARSEVRAIDVVRVDRAATALTAVGVGVLVGVLYVYSTLGVK